MSARTLEGEATISVLAAELDRSRNYVFEIVERMSALLEYLDTEGENRSGRLPRLEEFRELADKYRVAV